MNTTIKNVYDKYKQDIYVYLIGLTHNQALAEDLTSEVFVAAIKSLPNFKGKSELKTWLFAIARHKWYETLRPEKKTQVYLSVCNTICKTKTLLMKIA